MSNWSSVGAGDTWPAGRSALLFDEAVDVGGPPAVALADPDGLWKATRGQELADGPGAELEQVLQLRAGQQGRGGRNAGILLELLHRDSPSSVARRAQAPSPFGGERCGEGRVRVFVLG